jgi:hypothetical protein
VHFLVKDAWFAEPMLRPTVLRPVNPRVDPLEQHVDAPAYALYAGERLGSVLPAAALVKQHAATSKIFHPGRNRRDFTPREMLERVMPRRQGSDGRLSKRGVVTQARFGWHIPRHIDVAPWGTAAPAEGEPEERESSFHITDPLSAWRVGATSDASLDFVDKTCEKAVRPLDCAANNGAPVVSINYDWAQVF